MHKHIYTPTHTHTQSHPCDDAQYDELVLAVMTHYFPAPGAPADYCNRPDLYEKVVAAMDSYVTADMRSKLDATGRVPKAGDVKYIFSTRAGPGPVLQPASESLLSSETGLPVAPGPKHKRMKITN
jgi:hypothetical protein